MVEPAQSQRILAGLLHPGSPIAAGPVVALGRKEEVRGPARAEVRHRGANHVHGVREAVLCLRKMSLAPPQCLLVAEDAVEGRRGQIRHFPAGKAVPLHDPHFGAILLGDAGLAQLVERWALDRHVAHALGNQKIGNRLDPQYQPPRRLVVNDDLRKEAAGVFPDRQARAAFRAIEPRLLEQRGDCLLPRQAEVIGPVDQSRPRFVEQSLRKPPRVGTLFAELGEELLNDFGRLRLRLPREFFHGLGPLCCWRKSTA